MGRPGRPQGSKTSREPLDAAGAGRGRVSSGTGRPARAEGDRILTTAEAARACRAAERYIAEARERLNALARVFRVAGAPAARTRPSFNGYPGRKRKTLGV